MTPRDLRQACRSDEVTVYPSTLLSGYLCLNLVILDRDHAPAFAAFCAANQNACPLIWQGAPGQFSPPPEIAANCDLRQDLRLYDVLIHGEKDRSVTRVDDLWTDRSVAFLIGSSVSFDGLLADRGLAPDWGPAVMSSGIRCQPAEPFSGPMALTLRIWEETVKADEVAAFTARFPRCHGGPIHRGAAEQIPVNWETDLLLPWPGGDCEQARKRIAEGAQALWWACGVTPFLAAKAAKLPLMIVHRPGNAMPSDLRTEALAE
ncbi:MAG: DUF1445 domain-containing protein [Opitutales bacterium]|nr:DUF1445 domain-containing protein [Opitutales bacterium]